MLIGKRVKEARLKKGLSQQQVADALGVSKVSVCGYEKGTRTPSLEIFDALTEFLEIDINYALGKDKVVVAEKDTPYAVKVADEDLEIIKSLKKCRELYNQICEDPKRVIELINLKMNKK